MSCGEAVVVCERFAPRTSVIVAQRVPHRPARGTSLVSHPFAVLSLCIEGRVTLEQRGHWSLAEGDVMLLPAGAAHRGLGCTEAKLWMLGLAPSCLLAREQAHLLEPFEQVRAGASAVVSIPGPRRQFVLQLFVELERELALELSGHEVALESLLTLLLGEVTRARALQTPQQVARAAPDDVVSASLRFIEQNCLRALSLRDVADAVHRSPAHLTTMVRHSTGQTVGAWIVAGRMAEARRRLLHSDELVEVIAERVGYADATHFTRLFRRVQGQTPAAFRAQRRASARG